MINIVHYISTNTTVPVNVEVVFDVNTGISVRESFTLARDVRITWMFSMSRNTNDATLLPPKYATFSKPFPCIAFAFAFNFGRASAMRNGNPDGHVSRTDRHIFLSWILLINPETPVNGCAARVNGAFVSGCIHTNAGNRPIDRCVAADTMSSSLKLPGKHKLAG